VTHIVDEDTEENIPFYLSKGSKSFKHIVEHVSSPERIEEIRQMAILMYQLAIIHLQKSLWMTYLKSGTGKLKSCQTGKVGPAIWPVEVQSMMKGLINENDHTNCLTYVTDYLSDLENQIGQYQTELSMKKNQLSNYIQTIETFVQQGLDSTRLEIQHQIALVQYTYNDRVLELEYLQHTPTEHQVSLKHFFIFFLVYQPILLHLYSHQKRIMKELCHAKYQEETTKGEFSLVQQRISIHTSHQSFDLAQETLFDQIEDQHMRRKLHDQYINVAKQAKDEMIQLCLSSAEAQMHRYHQQFTAKLKQFWQEQRSLPNDQKLPNIMINLMEQRWKNISESVKCAYKYRTDLIHFNFMNP
jgi:hypothetical protein